MDQEQSEKPDRNPLSFFFPRLGPAFAQRKAMATTLGLLNLPALSHKTIQTQLKLPFLSRPSKTHLSEQSHETTEHVKQQFAQIINRLKSAPLPLTALALPFLADSKDALAAGGEFGILEGRTFALIHPLVMAGLFFYTLWAGYLGWQWRRVRTIQNEINELKKQVQPASVAPEGATLSAAASTSVSLSPVEAKIQQLTEERKELIKGSYRDRHFNAGSILLGFGVFEAIGGGVNTWFRTGKLFPGPHLFAGAAITVLWAAAAALVPAMQKGSETARSLHIALNALNVLLFIWQIPTGFDIVLKVFEFTKWP
ncbi:hypothetical protein NE237_013874 [Protea cynaroides]|uniref:DUF4079 domain-containing protein n=1 Tax=Protea cynaroides TaxID=273540 RepID=A0A9Q0JYZ6_9MAGN|nr:hypothetical protein NE237_013874 [Protea cynaroides]